MNKNELFYILKEIKKANYLEIKLGIDEESKSEKNE